MPGTPLAQSVAVITGGGAGIGFALAQALAARGARVVVSDRRLDAAQRAAELICASGGNAIAVVADVASPADVQALVDTTVARYGRVDYLFNNAGIGLVGEAQHLTLEHWQRLVSVNLMGVVHGVHAVYPLMVRQRSGHIVNVASTAGIVPAPFQVAYAATKHAVVGLSLSLRAEAAQYRVRVSAVCPGWIDTQMKDEQEVVGLDRARVVSAVPIQYYSAERCAEDILNGVLQNRYLITVTAFSKWTHRTYRLFPVLFTRLSGILSRRALSRH